MANRPLVQALRQLLGVGEAEAIALALEVGAEFLGVRTVGPAGVLLEAKRKGVISAVKPYLDALRSIAGFRLADEVYLRVLREAGEV